MKNIVKYGSVALALATIAVGLASLSTGTGCAHCDGQSHCLAKEGLLVQDKIYPVCDAEPTHDGDRYTWATDTGDCSCTLESGDIAGYNWRNCTFEPK